MEREEVRAFGEEVRDGRSSLPNSNIIPPAGAQISRKRLIFKPPRVGQVVYAYQDDLLVCWERATIIDIIDGPEGTLYKVKMKNGIFKYQLLPGKHIAFAAKWDQQLQLTPGTRVIAKFSDIFHNNPSAHNRYFAGIVAETFSLENKNRYLIFFDDTYCQYVSPSKVKPVVDSPENVWDDVHSLMQWFIKSYLTKYPTPLRPLITPNLGEKIKLEGSVMEVKEFDCSLIRVCHINNDLNEWIYRGLPRLEWWPSSSIAQKSSSKDDLIPPNNSGSAITSSSILQKSSNYVHPTQSVLESLKFESAGKIVKIVFPYSRPTPQLEYTPHECKIECSLKYNEENYRSVSPLVIPFHLGWGRIREPGGEVLYVTPCGLHLWTYNEIRGYNWRTKTGIPIDFFSLDLNIACLDFFQVERKNLFIIDISLGEEWTPVECVNSIDYTEPMEFTYIANSVSRPGIEINDKPEYLVCCDCADGCMDKERCPCWKLTLSGISFQTTGCEKPTGYENRRLPGFVSSGIYECNRYCKCNVDVCTNRVVQNKVNWPVQVFKTAKKGWGVRALYDIPKGSFLCVYTGEILDNTQAEEEGKHNGDEYIADLDYIEVMESKKEGYESDCYWHSESSDSGSDIRKRTNSFHSRARKSTSGGEILFPTTKRPCLDNQYMKQSKYKDKAIRFRKYCNPEISDDELKPYAVNGKHKGNFGRFFNHSCQPNLFIQSVFVNTHDVRFPNVAFFTKEDVKAGTELCWDYRYQVNSVPGKSLNCYCESSKCRIRLL